MKYFNNIQANNRTHGPKTGSQGGEDGVIEYLLDALQITDGICCEIGAWDGKFLSNTYALVKRGFTSIMLEGDPERYAKLAKTAKQEPGIVPVQAMVTPENITGLVYEATYELPIRLAVCSIDIDGGEEEIWKSLVSRGYVFPIVLVEWCDRGKQHHWPVLSMAHELGYTPVTCTNSNLFFVRSDMYGEMTHRLAEAQK
jgi:hypothetical protein